MNNPEQVVILLSLVLNREMDDLKFKDII